MNRRLTDQQIEHACRALLRLRRHVTVRDVRSQLRQSFTATGRTERVARILKALQDSLPAPNPQPGDAETTRLRQELQAAREQADRAEQRAARAEQIADDHQDFWARRYDEKVQQLEQQHASHLEALRKARTAEYLRIHLRAAELTRRLAQYESTDPLPAFPQDLDHPGGGAHQP